MIGLTVGDMGEIFPNFFMTLLENECLRIFRGINNNRNAFEYFFLQYSYNYVGIRGQCITDNTFLLYDIA